jgi:hypothetical protein
MSTAITCPVTQRKDVLFYVLYGANTDSIAGWIEESALNIAEEYPADGVREALQLLRPAEGDSLNKLRAKFFLLLNEDGRMRERLGRVQHHLMISLCDLKAERFYDSLCDELIPVWIKDESVALEEFVDRLRAAYLVS